MAPAVQVDVDIFALVDPGLPGRHNQDTVFHARDVHRARHPAGNDQAAADISHRQPRERCATLSGGHGHVDDAVFEVCQAPCCRGPRR